MRRLTSIVALNGDGAIGIGNALPWRVRSDLRFFRASTVNQVVIMGRRTYESLPGPLPERMNVVVTHGFSLFQSIDTCKAAGSIAEALDVAASLAGKKREVFVVGGASMYEQFAPYVDRYLVTEVDKEVPNADTFFDASLIGDLSGWKVDRIGEGQANGGDDEAAFRIYELKSRKPEQFAQYRNDALSSIATRKSGNRLGFASPDLRVAC